MKARILSLEEVENTQAPVYIEHYQGYGDELLSELIKTIRYEWPDCDDDYWVSFAYGGYPRDGYGHSWRAWSAEPTSEQRLATRPESHNTEYGLRLGGVLDEMMPYMPI